MLNPSLRSCICFWKRVLREERGRPVPFDLGQKSLHVTFSDGEGTGSVAVGWWQPRNNEFRPRVTQVELPTSWRQAWCNVNDTTKQTDITEVEAIGPILALGTWPDLADGMWVHFVDNEGAEGAAIKGSSKVLALNFSTPYIWETARK